MALKDFMNKVRYWDNIAAKWIIRHFYLLFFEILLVLIFVAFFILSTKTWDVAYTQPSEFAYHRLLLVQTFAMNIIIFLLLLNSFWMLYMFNSVIRIRTLLRELNFNLSRRFRS